MESDVGIPSHIWIGATRAEALPLLRQSRIADVTTASSLFGLLLGFSHPRRRDKLRSSRRQCKQLNSEKPERTVGYDPLRQLIVRHLLTGVQKNEGGRKMDPRGTKIDTGVRDFDPLYLPRE